MFEIRECVSSRGLFHRPNGISNGMDNVGTFDVWGSSLENCAEKRGAARVRGNNHSVGEELRVGKVPAAGAFHSMRWRPYLMSLRGGDSL